MMEHSWFRLLVRVVGLLLIGISIPSVISSVGSLTWALSPQVIGGSGTGTWYFVYYLASVAGALGQSALGVYLLFFGNGFIRRCLNDVRDRCPACQYDIRGLASTRCPECGGAIPQKTATPPVSSTP